MYTLTVQPIWPTSRYYTREMKTYVHVEVFMQIFVAFIFNHQNLVTAEMPSYGKWISDCGTAIQWNTTLR